MTRQMFLVILNCKRCSQFIKTTCINNEFHTYSATISDILCANVDDAVDNYLEYLHTIKKFFE